MAQSIIPPPRSGPLTNKMLAEEISGADPQLSSALESAHLPTDDLIEPGRQFFRFTENDRLIGFVGWEINSDHNVLLRSLVIMPSERGKGAGKAIVVWALTRLAELDMENVFILTTTAEAFTIKLGFVRCDRQAVPQTIRQSQQYSALCPASTVALRQTLR